MPANDDQRPISGMDKFLEGARSPLTGIAFMNRHPSLWRYAALPILINAIITTFVLICVVLLFVWIIGDRPFDYGATWAWLLLEILLDVLTLVVLLGMVFAAWLILGALLSDYFLDKLVRQVELRLGLSPDEMHDVPLLHSAIDTLKSLSLLIFINVALLTLHVVPVIGSAVGLGAALYWDSLIFGYELFAYPLALRGKRREEIKAFTKKHRPYTLGLGASVLALGLVPLVGAVTLTTAATGATLLHRRLSDDRS
jgi:uncharacterized protein involved in cysteine biosynthesis